MTASTLALDPPARPARGRRGRRVALVLALWAVAGLVSAQMQLIALVRAGMPVTVWPVLRWNLWSVALWAAFTPAILALARRYPVDRERGRRTVPVHVLAALVVAATDALATTAAAPWVFPFPRLPSFGDHLFEGLFVNLSSYLVVAAIAHVARYAELYRDRAVAAARLEAQLTEARLAALQAQLHPHFLFNTLNAIAEQVHVDADVADAMILRLGALLRASLRAPECPEVSLGEELELTRAYLELMELRLRDRLRIVIDAPPALLGLRVPALLLQPLVENALRHGIERRATAGLVEVAARVQGDRLVLEVRDDGAGPPAASAASAAGTGLRNTRARLAQAYGAAASLVLAARAGGGAIATIALPARQHAMAGTMESAS